MINFDKISICVDCLMKLANDENPTEPTNCVPLSAIPDNMDITLGGDEEGFSWSSCDGCDCSLGGDRFTAYLSERTKS
jgi:hypothetical protein